MEPKNSKALIRQADRRRAISTAYYAVFHLALTAVADEFVGRAHRATPRYALVYRCVDHKALEALCRIASKEQLPDKYARYVSKKGFETSIRQFATLILELKEKRTSADYDPSHWVKIADASKAIDAARSAIKQFSGAPVSQRKAFLTLLLFPPR